MLIERVIREFGYDTPIFAEEILELFNEFTRAYVFRLVKKAENAGELVCYSRGVYYVPRKTFFGVSTICSEQVAEKKYLRDGDSIYGIYSGLSLLNQFGITTQVPNILEIVTNNETTRKRKVVIDGKEFILRKARCEITSENYPEYSLLQLFNDIDQQDSLDEFAKGQIGEYIRKNQLTNERINAMSLFFPAMASKNMLRSGVLNGTL